MKTELLHSYSTNNLTSLSRNSSKISLALEHNTSYNIAATNFGSVTGKSDINLNINGEVETIPEDEDSYCSNFMTEKEVKKIFPIIEWLPDYNLENLVADIVAGITIGLTVLPQGLAYATLAGLPPQYGLYSSFVGCFIYIFLGSQSTKSVTIGPTAVLAIMTLSYSAGKPPEYGVLLGLLTGIVTFCMGVLRLGFIVNFISSPTNSAFTSAAAITIMSTQFKNLLGLSYPAEGFSSIVMGAIEHISEVKLSDTILSLVCVITLIFLQYLPNMFSSLKITHRKLHKALWFVSVARNAIVIVACTVIFTLLQSDTPPVKVVGNLTSGLPPFQLPPFTFTDANINTTYTFWKLLKEDSSACIVMPLLAIMEHITIAKKFAGTSRVNFSQEMISIGVANIFGSFFSSMAVTGSFSRTTVNHASGCKSPLGGLFTGILVLLSLQFLTPYFYYIPKASLGAVILCAMAFTVDFSILYPMWKTKKMDLLPWTVTFIISLLVGLEFGILSGLIISIVFLLYYAARPGVRVSKGETQSGIAFIMVSSDRSLVFPAIEYTKYIIMKSGQVWGSNRLPIVVDCHHIHFIDYTAAEFIKPKCSTAHSPVDIMAQNLGIRDLFTLYNEKRQDLILWKIKPSILRVLTQVMDVADIPFKHCETEHELEACLLQSRIQSQIGNDNDGYDGSRKLKFTIAETSMDNQSTETGASSVGSGSSSPANVKTTKDRKDDGVM